MSDLPRWVPRFYVDFWSGPTISAVQLARFRLVFFSLLAIDAFLIVAHAPRYGAGNFNVGHLPALDAVATPTRGAIVLAALVMTYLAARVALGVATRLAVPLLAASYGAVYMSSQLDSFQHHYLLALLLVTSCFVNWDRAGDEGAKTPRRWPVRLLLLQVSVVYAFAAISKMESGWWDGRALAAMLARSDETTARALIEAIGTAPAAKLTVLTELFLAVAIHIRALRVPAAVVGIGLHVGIEAAGFEIGLFSYYMIAIYLLVLPPSAFRWSAFREPLRRRLERAAGRGPLVVWVVAVVAIAATAIGVIPLDGAPLAAAVATAIGLWGIAATRQRRAAAAHALAALAVLACAVGTDAVRDHYRFWGGSARRLGDIGAATRAYERLVAIEPDYAPGRRNLGGLYATANDLQAARKQYEAALELEPDAVAGHLGLARVHDQLGNGEKAVAAAARARELATSEGDAASAKMKRAAAEARRIESRWRSRL